MIFFSVVFQGHGSERVPGPILRYKHITACFCGNSLADLLECGPIRGVNDIGGHYRVKPFCFLKVIKRINLPIYGEREREKIIKTVEAIKEDRWVEGLLVKKIYYSLKLQYFLVYGILFDL